MARPNDPASEPTGSALSALASFVRAHEEEVLGAWTLAVAERPAMRDAVRTTFPAGVSPLPSSVSPLLAALARAPGDLSTFEAVGRELALTQLAGGVELAELVAQYSILRDILIDRWSDAAAPADARPGAAAIHRASDAVVGAAVAATEDLRAKSLNTIQGLSLAVLENVTLDELLQRLLAAFHELAPSVHAAAFYLCERDDDRLRVNAYFGMTDEDARAATIRVGEGFLGQVAAEKRPLFARVPGAAHVMHAPWKAMGAVHALPLIVRGRLVGVGVMGSWSSWDIAKADQMAFDVVAKQATSNIYDWKVRESIDDQKARLDAVLGQMPAGVILGEAPSGRLSFHNAQVEAIWRRPFISCSEIGEYRAWPAYRLDGRRLEPEEYPLARAIAGEVVVNHEFEILRGDGTRGTILSNAAPILAVNGRIVGGVTTFVDVTEKRTTERQLKQMAAQAKSAETVQAIVAEASAQLAESFSEGTTLRSIVALAVPRIADGCAVFLFKDEEGRQLLELAHVDPRKETLLRVLFDHRSLLGRAGAEIGDRVCRTHKPEVIPVVTEEFVRGHSASEEEMAAFRELGLKSLMIFPLVARGRILGSLVFATTRSRKEFSQQDFALAQELVRRSAFTIDNERLYQEAQRAVRLREEVLEVISHDLRSPLSSVRLCARALAEHDTSQDHVKRRADQMLAASARMERLIRDLMDFAAVRSGRLSIQKESTEIEGMLRELCDACLDTAERAGIAVESQVEPGLPHVNIDRERVLQALENLVANAVKVTVAGQTVTVGASRRDGTILFSVTDQGPGIPPEDVPHVFDRYYRGKGARGTGLGLGLPITRAIVEGHGGHIWVESTVGQGSAFFFTLPQGGQ